MVLKETDQHGPFESYIINDVKYLQMEIHVCID